MYACDMVDDNSKLDDYWDKSLIRFKVSVSSFVDRDFSIAVLDIDIDF